MLVQSRSAYKVPISASWATPWNESKSLKPDDTVRLPVQETIDLPCWSILIIKVPVIKGYQNIFFLARQTVYDIIWRDYNAHAKGL